MFDNQEAKEISKQIEHRMKVYREALRYLPHDESGIHPSLQKALNDALAKELAEQIAKLVQIVERNVWKGF